MAKVILGNRPKNFKHTVEFTDVDGEQYKIECVFKYRTRQEFADFFDQINADERQLEAEKKNNEHGGDVFSLRRFIESTDKANAKWIAAALEGWNLDFPMNGDTILQLVNEIPSASKAIMDAYRAAIVEGRLGN